MNDKSDIMNKWDGIEDPEEVKRKLAEIQRKLIYEYQDVRELRATRILKHLWQSNRLDRQFNKGFKDALLVAEEIYDWDIIGLSLIHI